jgi:hypothetical protein
VVDYVGVGKYTCCGEVAGIARQSDYPEPCLLRRPTIYTGRQSWDDLRADLNKVAVKQGFQFTFVIQNTHPKPQHGHYLVNDTKWQNTKFANMSMITQTPNLPQE